MYTIIMYIYILYIFVCYITIGIIYNTLSSLVNINILFFIVYVYRHVDDDGLSGHGN